MTKPAKSKPKAELTPAQRQLLLHSLLAFALVVGVGFWVWQSFVVATNSERFERRASRLVVEQSQVLANYVNEVVQSLSEVASRVDAAQWLLHGGVGESGYGLQNDVRSQLPEAVSARLYVLGQAQQEKELGGNISFVEVDMVNRLERGQMVFPEAAKQIQTGDWLIHWVVPIIGEALDESAQPPLAGTLLVATSLDGLNSVLSGSELSLGQYTLVQRIGSQRILKFLSMGSPGSYDIQSHPINDTHWQLEFQPSDQLRRQTAGIPFLIILALLALAVIVGFAVWTLYQTKLRQEKATTKLFRDIAPTEPESSKASEEKPESEADEPISNPIYLHDQVVEEEPLSDELATINSEAGQGQYVDSMFRAYDIRGIAGTEVTNDFAFALGKVLATEALALEETSIHVGYDARSHSPELCRYLQQGILSVGCDVVDMGLVPTPLVNFAINTSEQNSSGVVVTASHNPKSYNGFKMILNGHSFVEADIQRIKQRINNKDWSDSEAKGVLAALDYQDEYIDAIISDIAIVSGLRIVVDAANGAASQLAPALLEELGCEVLPLYCEFDGEFPNHDPDPSVPANLDDLIQRVKDEEADMGIALDGDGDRLVVVSSAGQIIWPDQLLMLFAKDVVSRNPGCDVVFDVKSTRHLSALIASYGGRPIMWKTGHSNIKAKLKESDALLAGEYSGHIFFKERWYGFDDGLYAAARLLEIMSLRDQSLDDMLSALPEVAATPEIKLAVAEDEKFSLIENLIQQGDFEGGEKVLIDGVRVDFAKGWGLARASNTSPAITLRFEADDLESLNEIKNLFKQELASVDSSLVLEF